MGVSSGPCACSLLFQMMHQKSLLDAQPCFGLSRHSLCIASLGCSVPAAGRTETFAHLSANTSRGWCPGLRELSILCNPPSSLQRRGTNPIGLSRVPSRSSAFLQCLGLRTEAINKPLLRCHSGHLGVWQIWEITGSTTRWATCSHRLLLGAFVPKIPKSLRVGP